MSTHDRQTELDTDEQRIAALYRSLPAGEPSPALDARIRAQAHAAVRSKRPTWLWGAGVAASAVLAVGMFWRMGLPEMQQRGPATSTDSASAPAADEAVVLDSVVMTPPPPPPEPRRDPAAPAASSGMRDAEETVGAARPAPPTAQSAREQAIGEDRAGSEATLATTAAERAAAPAVVAPAPAKEQEAFADGRAETVPEEAKAEAAAAAPPRLKRAETSSGLRSTEKREAEAVASFSGRSPLAEEDVEPVANDGWIAREDLPDRQQPGDPPPLVFDEPAFRPPLALPEEPDPPASAARTDLPPPVPVEEPSPMAIELPTPAPPAPRAPAVDLPEQAARTIVAEPKAGSRAADNAERETERQPLGKPKDADAIAAAIAELPRRYRRDLENNAKLAPASWLGRIETLLASDKREETVANLRVFHAAYPEHELPDALAALAREEGIVSDDAQTQ